MDCLIVGGGLIGMLCARELVRDGADVCVVDQGEIAKEASWAGGGILSPLYPWRYDPAVTALASWSQQRYGELSRQLLEESGVDPQWQRSGLLIVGEGSVESPLAWAGRNGVAMEQLEGEALRRCEPALASCWSSALWMPEVAQLRNPRLLKALKRSLLEAGAVLLEHTTVTDLMLKASRTTGVETGCGRLAADRVIIAAGAWSGRLAPLLQRRIEPVQGQMIAFRASRALLSRIVLHHDHYVIPRRDGLVLAGSTLEYRGFDKQITAQARSRLREAACRMVPALSPLEVVFHWAGLRPGSLHGVPYIGGYPGIENLFVNVGHFRNGVVTGLASARLLADIIGGREPVVNPDSYAILE